MVLGLKSRRQNSGSVQLEYIVRVMEIKPWPTSEPLKSNQSILLHWEHSDKKTGSLSSTVGNAKVEFNGLFVLPLTLVRDKKGVNKFQKNLLEFQVYETSKDRTNKGQIFGTAMVNLADYGIIEENLTLSVPLSCKKGYKNVQPVLFLKLQPIDKDSLNSSPKSSVSKESVSGLTSEDIDHEFEIASFTDDDVSPQSSLNFKQTNENSNASSPLFYNGGNHVKYPRFPERTMTLIHNKKSVIPRFKSSSSSVGFQNKHADPEGKIKEKAQLDMDCSGDVCVIRPKGSIDSKGENKEKAQLDMDCSGNACVGRPKGSIKVEDRTVDKTQETVRVQQDEQSKPVDKFFQGESRSIDDHKLRNVKSVRLPHDSARVQTLKTEKASATCNAATQTNEAMSGFSDSKVEVHSRIEMLEEELREAAAIEVSLYSVVAEHGGSTNKVHAPARRLSRFYLHACNSRNQARMAGAARAAVSGLVLVSKACGNDVPRLTFWLSNSIMLRAIISHAVKSNNGGGSVSSDSVEESEETATFTIALETIEAWIFSRIIESIWWQTLTPYMQSTAAKACNKPVGSGSTKPNRGSHGLSNQDQGNFSVELWKKAFKDACERLCPIRASGHECGCLPLLPRMVMEQLVGRLDVAMFNAILRESAEEMPTDPVSDPICDSYVLPIPVGKSSFGSGAQLKNAIGDWSRWLTDLFDIEDTPENDTDNKSIVKPFRLLNALSDLMMLPPEILSDKPTRKEVCPAFAAPVIRRVLEVFVPDNFCPQRVPKSVLDALDSEDDLELDGESIRVIPCGASSTTYSPPTAASITNIIGDIDTHTLKRSGSSVMKKSYNSDDELDELDSPLASIIADGFHGSSPSLRKPIGFLKGNSGRNIVRYQLLREVWKEGEQ